MLNWAWVKSLVRFVLAESTENDIGFGHTPLLIDMEKKSYGRRTLIRY